MSKDPKNQANNDTSLNQLSDSIDSVDGVVRNRDILEEVKEIKKSTVKEVS